MRPATLDLADSNRARNTTIHFDWRLLAGKLRKELLHSRLLPFHSLLCPLLHRGRLLLNRRVLRRQLRCLLQILECRIIVLEGHFGRRPSKVRLCKIAIRHLLSQPQRQIHARFRVVKRLELVLYMGAVGVQLEADNRQRLGDLGRVVILFEWVLVEVTEAFLVLV